MGSSEKLSDIPPLAVSVIAIWPLSLSSPRWTHLMGSSAKLSDIPPLAVSVIASDKGFSQGWELFGAEWELGFHQLLKVFDNFLFLEDKTWKYWKFNNMSKKSRFLPRPLQALQNIWFPADKTIHKNITNTNYKNTKIQITKCTKIQTKQLEGFEEEWEAGFSQQLLQVFKNF